MVLQTHHIIMHFSIHFSNLKDVLSFPCVFNQSRRFIIFWTMRTIARIIIIISTSGCGSIRVICIIALIHTSVIMLWEFSFPRMATDRPTLQGI